MVMDNLDYVKFYVSGYSEDVQRKVVEILCSGVVNYGEQSQIERTVQLSSRRGRGGNGAERERSGYSTVR
eukprot:jgi/Undpi1/3441/HiC_scaffold_16.g06813.m1